MQKDSSKLAILLVSVAAFSLWAYSQAQKPDEAAPPTAELDQTMMPEQQPTLAGSYLAARHATLYADNEKASDFLTEALALDPEDKELTGQAIRSYLLAGKLDNAVKLAREKHALDVDTPLMHLILFIDDARNENWDPAATHLDKIRTYGLQAVTLPFLKSWVMLARTNEVKPPEEALVLKHSFYQAFVSYQNALLQDVAGRSELVEPYFDKALSDLTVVPQRFMQVAMQFYIREGKPEKAEQLYKDYQEANGGNLSLQVMPKDSLMKELKAMGDKRIVADARDGLAEVMFTMATLLHSEMVDREALVYVQLSLALRKDFPDAGVLMAEIYESLGKSDMALAAYRKVPKDSDLYRRAAIRQAFLLEETGRTEQSLMLLKELAGSQPRPSDIYMTMADILRNKNKYEEAATYYTKALDEVGEVKPYHWPLFYTRGISYERAGDWEKAEADFLKALSLEPDQPDVQNYLAYSWLLQGKNTEKATEMLEQAVATRPDDAHIIDSLAWAYFLHKRYDKALQYMEQAVEIMPHDPTVNDHYGDVLWRTGRLTEAKYQWQRALHFKPEKKDREAIVLKVENGLPDDATAPDAPSGSNGLRVSAQSK